MRAVDEHQRRVWTRMIESVDAFRADHFDLRKLVQDLQGLLGAADLHDRHLVNEWWNHEAPSPSTSRWWIRRLGPILRVRM
jgi:hypothetical protein